MRRQVVDRIAPPIYGAIDFVVILMPALAVKLASDRGGMATPRAWTSSPPARPRRRARHRRLDPPPLRGAHRGAAGRHVDRRARRARRPRPGRDAAAARVLYGFAEEHASLADRGFPVVVLWAGVQLVAIAAGRGRPPGSCSGGSSPTTRSPAASGTRAGSSTTCGCECDSDLGPPPTSPRTLGAAARPVPASRGEGPMTNRAGSVLPSDFFERLSRPPGSDDPHAHLEQLRVDPVPRLRSGELVLARHRDVVGVLRDPSFVKPRLPSIPIPAVRATMRNFLLLDGPDHTRLRRAVARSSRRARCSAAVTASSSGRTGCSTASASSTSSQSRLPAPARDDRRRPRRAAGGRGPDRRVGGGPARDARQPDAAHRRSARCGWPRPSPCAGRIRWRCCGRSTGSPATPVAA